MEKYKKKKLNFTGYSREMRKTERENQRCVSRHQRFSVARSLDEFIDEEKNEKSTRIPTIGIPKDQSRAEMLAKWKQEKMVKKQHESRLKKPTFKVGVVNINHPPSLGNKPLFALDVKSSILFKSSFQMSNSQLSGKKQEIQTKTSKDKIIQPFKSKIVAASKPESQSSLNKECNLKPKVDPVSKILNKDQLFCKAKQPIGSKAPLEAKKMESCIRPLTAKPKVTPLPMDTKKNESCIRPLTSKPKVTPLPMDTKKNNPPSRFLKPPASRTLGKGSSQISGLPKPTASSLPKPTTSRTFGKGPNQDVPIKTDIKSIPKFSKASSQQKVMRTIQAPTQSPAKGPKRLLKDQTKKPDEVATFQCELSHIEPVVEKRKSFAPPGFVFQPPTELNFSLFLEDGPSAIFTRMKNQFLRTSTPKQSPSSRESNSGTESSKCLENDVAKSPKDKENTEDTQCFKDADNKLEPSTKNNVSLNSAHESINLNDPENTNHKKSLTKPIDCKLKLEFPEVVSSQNQDQGPSSLKVAKSEYSLATELTAGGAINTPILPDSVKIDKTEIKFLDTCAVDDSKTHFPEVLSVSEVLPASLNNVVKPIVDNQPFKYEYPEIISSQNQEGVCLSKITHPECFLPVESAPDKLSNQPILPKSLEADKIDCKITIPFPKDITPKESDSTCIEQNGNEEKNLNLLNSFLPKQDNGPLKIPGRKIRNLRQSEKPGLSSINESIENTPKSALKIKLIDSVFSPRRSLRLAKLSGNFSSLENLQDYSKPNEDEAKAGLKSNFTPRRSKRLSKFSWESNSYENLFEIRRPTLCGTPEADEVVPKLNSKVVYDFDRLSLETEEETKVHGTTRGKVSLLYTPPNKYRTSIYPVKEDLMSFSPKT